MFIEKVSIQLRENHKREENVNVIKFFKLFDNHCIDFNILLLRMIMRMITMMYSGICCAVSEII